MESRGRLYSSSGCKGCTLFLRRTGHGIVGRREGRKRPVLANVGIGEVAVLAGISYGIIGASVIPLLGESGSVEKEEEDEVGNIRWSVMGILSCFPYLNYMGWVFAALDDEEDAQMYWVFACLYAAPYVVDGLRLDGFTLLCLGLCVIHTQIERVGKTEGGLVRRQLQDAGMRLLPRQQKRTAWLSSLSSTLTLLADESTDESNDESNGDDDDDVRIQAELDAFDKKLNILENE